MNGTMNRPTSRKAQARLLGTSLGSSLGTDGQPRRDDGGWEEASPTALLVLADGTVLEGQGFGGTGHAVGEVCFNTAMTGYQEILTDPSYAGQIITFTFPHIGNVGTNDEDIETVNLAATPGAGGVVLHSAITAPSNYRATRHLDQWLKSRGVTCLPFGNAGGGREVILVGNPPEGESKADKWKGLAVRIARGGIAVFLSHAAFQRGKDPVGWLPLSKKGRCYYFVDHLYHKECVAKAHPIFEGLQSRSILDWYYYGELIPHFVFDGQSAPDEVIATSFAGLAFQEPPSFAGTGPVGSEGPAASVAALS